MKIVFVSLTEASLLVFLIFNMTATDRRWGLFGEEGSR